MQKCCYLTVLVLLCQWSLCCSELLRQGRWPNTAFGPLCMPLVHDPRAFESEEMTLFGLVLSDIQLRQ
eukprot:353113-Amphidinium_carterae.1